MRNPKTGNTPTPRGMAKDRDDGTDPGDQSDNDQPFRGGGGSGAGASRGRHGRGSGPWNPGTSMTVPRGIGITVPIQRWGAGGRFPKPGSWSSRERTTVQTRQGRSPVRTDTNAVPSPSAGARSSTIPVHATTCRPVPGPRDRIRARRRPRRWAREMGIRQTRSGATWGGNRQESLPQADTHIAHDLGRHGPGLGWGSSHHRGFRGIFGQQAHRLGVFLIP